MLVVHNPFRTSTVLAVLISLLLLGCSRPPEIIGIENASISASTTPDLSRHRIFIATTRSASNEPGALLSASRASSLGLASVEVTVPPTHVVGQLERPKDLPPDPRTEFSAVEARLYGNDAAMIDAINRELAARPVGQRRLLLFVHGYNNTTSDALLRLAQFVEDTGFQGVPILFSWASAATTSRYVYDLNSALIARGEIRQIADIMAQTNAESSDVFAHSMGTFLTMEGLVDLQQAGTLGRRGTINHVMLASPDIDIDLFRSQLGQLSPAIRDRIYVLVSRDDKALRVSSRIAGGIPRVGVANTAELEQLGVTVIDLSEIGDSSSGSHSKFAGSPDVVQLIGAGLNSVGRFGEDTSPAVSQILSVSPIRIFGD
ncbi:alpha/beta hydrolase [Paracoccus benzoatiresistens]|uniref:Alpha/beta hydrolase n=1 Tax=Paracoccus benzoatiresistens TaxID=2997341 RepID=A0ABT4JB87_9RHOB|nr:alpha/beta hydrolase [Paracoccus sp. EF6]MCZ0963852.1 alpha/beta hydrolase [Paracoccus sp. EF6]